MKIITNHHSRHIVYGFELTKKEREDFDYYTSEELDSASFFRYRGLVYDIGQFMRVPDSLSVIGWDGYSSDSYFSGILVRYTDDMESVIPALYLA